MKRVFQYCLLFRTLTIAKSTRMKTRRLKIASFTYCHYSDEKIQKLYRVEFEKLFNRDEVHRRREDKNKSLIFFNYKDSLAYSLIALNIGFS